MQTQSVLEHVQTQNPPPEMYHLYCCNEDLALCGTDISNDHERLHLDEDQICVVCHDLDHEGFDCPKC